MTEPDPEDQADDETLPAPDPTLSFPDDPVHTSVRLNPDEPDDPGRTPDLGPAADRLAELGLGRVVARQDGRSRARFALDEDPTPLAWEAMETVVNERPSPPRDFAAMVRREEVTPVELSYPSEYTLPDLRPADEPSEEEALPTGPTPRALPPDGYDEVFPVRTDPALALPPPPPRTGRAGEETRDLLQTGEVPLPVAPLPDPVASDPGLPSDPGTQWLQRPREEGPPHVMLGTPLQAAHTARSPSVVDRRSVPPADEPTDIRGIPEHATFDDDDDAPTVIVVPTPGQFGTPAPEERAFVPPSDEPTEAVPVVPAGPTATARAPRPPLSEPEPADWSAVAASATALGVSALIAVIVLLAATVLRWSGVW